MAQRLILSGLRHHWPQISIVGEEEEEEETEAEPGAGADPVVDMKLCLDLELPAELKSLSACNFCIFVDPVDGTREFVEGRLESVQCLIGIAYKGRQTVTLTPTLKP